MVDNNLIIVGLHENVNQRISHRIISDVALFSKCWHLENKATASDIILWLVYIFIYFLICFSYPIGSILKH